MKQKTKQQKATMRITNRQSVSQEKLIRANRRFVVSVAKQYQNQGLTLSELINEGNLGLIKAASKYDATRGFKFISYAVWWIRQSILQALANQSRMVHMTGNQVDQVVTVSKYTPITVSKEIESAISILTDREREIIRLYFGIGCSEMTLEEIAHKYDLPSEHVRQIKNDAIRRLRKDGNNSFREYIG